MHRYLEEMMRQQEMAKAQEQHPKTKRRYASRSPARGKINRVTSMPSHTALLANELNAKYHEEAQAQPTAYRNANALAYAASMPQQPRPMVNIQPAVPTTIPSNVSMVQKEPPSYQETIVRLAEAQAQQQPLPKPATPPNGMNPMISVNPTQQKNNIGKRASLDPVSMKEDIANYPMMSQLLPELLNGFPSSSSSDETVGAPVIPPKDYESPQYDTPPEEIQENGTLPNDAQLQNWINMQVVYTEILHYAQFREMAMKRSRVK